MNKPTNAPNLSRRGFLDWMIAAFSTVAATALTLPGLLYLWPAAKGGTTEEVEVKGGAEMKPGDHVITQVRGKAVIVRRDSTGLVAYSAVCTHLGCLVKWESAKREFLCPCHAAIFDAEGRVVSGPAPAPLPSYKVKEVGGKVFVSNA